MISMSQQSILERLSERPLMKRVKGFYTAVVKSPTKTVTVYAAIYYSLDINVNKTAGYVGDTFTFTGRLMGFDPMAGSPFAVPNAVVNFYVNGVKALGAFKTDSNGYYSIPWTASSEGTISFYTEATTP